MTDKENTPLVGAGQDTVLVADGIQNEVCAEETQKTTDIPEPDPEEAVRFLKAMGDRPHVITAMPADMSNLPEEWPHTKDGKPYANLTRTIYSTEEIRDWVIRSSAKGVNLYYTPNILIGKMKKKPKKTDVATGNFLYADIDPRAGEDLAAEQARIIKEIGESNPKPSFTIFSGGGYQTIYRLDDPYKINGDLEKAADYESYNRALQSKFLGGDSTHNCERLLRLPGSINFPNKVKRGKGRKPARAYVVWELSNPDAAINLADMPKAAAMLPATAAKVAVNVGNAQRLKDAEELDKYNLPNWVKPLIVTGQHPKDPAKYPSRSEAVFAVVCQMARFSVSDDDMFAVITDPAFKISESILEKGADAEKYAISQIAKAKAIAEKSKPAIIVTDGKLVQIVDRAEKMLIEKESPIYQRGQMLARIVQLDKSADSEGVKRDIGTTILLEVHIYWLVEQMAKTAAWLKYNPKGELVPTDPPYPYAKHLAARQGEWNFRVLRGVIHTPTLRRDGSILQTPGYDPQSQLFFEPSGQVFPVIAEDVSKQDAEFALEKIKQIFEYFPFETEAARSVIIAAFLTGLIRRSIKTAPLVAIDAPTAGTGKSLLAEIIAIIITGHLPAMISQGKNPEEDEKRFSTILRSGDQVIVIDNCDLPLDGDFLCSMLTQEMVQARILGKSERVLLPSNSLIMATGNNLTLSGDISRRAVLCRIDAKTERPDARQFKFDPRDMAKQQRGELVMAGLAILRAYINAGRPCPLDKIGSFEEWNLVREPLVWLGCADPADTRIAVLQSDPRKAELSEILNAWHDLYGEEEKTIAEIRADYTKYEQNAKYHLLCQLLTDMTGRPQFNARSIGRNLKRHLGRIVGGKMLQWREDKKHGARWFVAVHNKQLELDCGEKG